VINAFDDDENTYFIKNIHPRKRLNSQTVMFQHVDDHHEFLLLGKQINETRSGGNNLYIPIRDI